MSNKMYKVVGVSRLNGEVKVRFSHDLTYVKKLAKANNVDIQLLEAPEVMSKPALTEWLKTTELYQNAEARHAIDERLDMYAAKARKAEVSVKAQPSLDSIKGRARAKAAVQA